MDEYSEEDCEVDPMKLSASASLAQNQANLTALVTRAWGDILRSFTKFPTYVNIQTYITTVHKPREADVT